MKVKINKTLDMYKDIFHCDTHDVDFSLPCIGEHINCEPKPTVTIIIPWSTLFRKCMNIKTGPNLADMVEGHYTETWVKNENDRVKLCDNMDVELEKLAMEMNKDDSM